MQSGGEEAKKKGMLQVSAHHGEQTKIATHCNTAMRVE
jgi:hypothetical protein